MLRGDTLGEILTTDRSLVRAGSGSVAQFATNHHQAAMAPPWTEAMRRAIRSVAELRQRVGLPPESAGIAAAERDFPTFVPLEFLDRIRPGDPRDPLLMQVLPSVEETLATGGFVSDPVGDSAARVAPQVLQKYFGRALVVTTGVCGVHCRYCFRREFDYSPAGSTGIAQDNHRSPDDATLDDRPWARSIDYLRKNDSIDEVILSGGDPLTLSDGRLDRLIGELESIAHVRRLRIHSRMPIVIPQRITAPLVDRLRASRLATWMVIHCNHAQEIDPAVDAAIAQMVDAGIPVLNQAVLLAGVNDDASILATLCRELVNRRVQPYYLHQLDRVRGAAHFEVPVERGKALVEAIRAELPGYAVPTYVTEIEGAKSKVPN